MAGVRTGATGNTTFVPQPVPNLMTSTPNLSPDITVDQIKDTVQSALSVIEGCVSTGESIMDLWKKAGASKKSRDLKRIIDRNREDLQAMIVFKEKIKKVNESMRHGNNEGIKDDLQEMINRFDEVPAEKLKMMTDVMCLAEASNIRKRFEQTGLELQNIDKSSLPDLNTKRLAYHLEERNRKLIVCISYVSKLLSKLFADSSLCDKAVPNQAMQASIKNRSKSTRKLYILGERLDMELPVSSSNFEFIGNLQIQREGGSFRKKSEGRGERQAEPRRMLTGYLKDSEGEIEVALQLIQPDDEDLSDGKLVARFEIDGQLLDESMPVIEIELVDEAPLSEAPMVVAVVKDAINGKMQEVEVQLVPTSEQIHGQIIEIKAAEAHQNQSEAAAHQSRLNQSQLRDQIKRLNQSQDSIEENIEYIAIELVSNEEDY